MNKVVNDLRQAFASKWFKVTWDIFVTILRAWFYATGFAASIILFSGLSSAKEIDYSLQKYGGLKAISTKIPPHFYTTLFQVIFISMLALTGLIALFMIFDKYSAKETRDTDNKIKKVGE